MIIFERSVELYLQELVFTLYEKEYFGFKEDAQDYVKWIISTILNELERTPRKIAPPYFKKYGKGLYYSKFKRNSNTQWYVFFNYENNIYHIRYIGNNHNCSQFL